MQRGLKERERKRDESERKSAQREGKRDITL